MTNLAIILFSLILLVGGWHLFEFLWDRRLFGHRGDEVFVVNLRAKKAAQLFRDRPDLLVIDVRPPASYEACHLPGAVNAPFLGETLEAGAFTGISRNRPVLVYCDGGFRSRLALAALRTEGFRAIFHLHRGLMSWKVAGEPVPKKGGA